MKIYKLLVSNKLYSLQTSAELTELGRELWAAAGQGKAGSVKMLLTAGADPNYQVKLLTAGADPNYQVKLLTAGADPSYQVKLLTAGADPNYQVKLLTAGADPNYQVKLLAAVAHPHYQVQLLAAAGQGKAGSVKMLLTAGTDPMK